MFETSKDVLFWVLSLAIISLTFFMCWAIYLVIKVFRQINDFVKTTKEKMEEFTDIIQLIKDKIINSASSLNAIAGAVNKIIEFFKEKKAKKEKKKKEDF